MIDVSHLANVHNFTLEYCHNLIDISFLSSVQKLTVSYCQGIINVDALHIVPDLTLECGVIPLLMCPGFPLYPS